MAVSLVPSARYGNCRHFCPYPRPRCVWFLLRAAARMHACTYAFADWPPSSLPPGFTRLSSARVVRALVPPGSYLGMGIS